MAGDRADGCSEDILCVGKKGRARSEISSGCTLLNRRAPQGVLLRMRLTRWECPSMLFGGFEGGFVFGDGLFVGLGFVMLN